MLKLTIVSLALVAVAQSAVLPKDPSLKRVTRCSVCGDFSHVPPPPPPGPPPPPPPPPPPFLRTQNWSGRLSSADGFQNAVFSGAAAAANEGAQSAGEAFSLASSAVNGPRPGYSNGGIKGGLSADAAGKYAGGSFKESHYSYHSGGRFGKQVENSQAGFNSASSSAQSGSGANNGAGFGTGRGGSEYKNSDNFESQQSTHHQIQSGGLGSSLSLSQSGGGNGVGSNGQSGFGGGYSASGSHESNRFEGQGTYGGSGLQQVQSGGFGSGSSSSSASSFSGNSGNNGVGATHGGFGGGHSSSGSHKSERFESHHESDIQQSQSNGFAASAGAQSNARGSADSQSGSLAASNNQEQSGDNSANSGGEQYSQYGSQAGGSLQFGSSADSQSALSGALNLASQGLQTASQSACSTCGKSSYALSNAKSNSGSAIAVSIGG